MPFEPLEIKAIVGMDPGRPDEYPFYIEVGSKLRDGIVTEIKEAKNEKWFLVYVDGKITSKFSAAACSEVMYK